MLRPFWALIGVGLLFAAWSGAVLAWDGSVYLFQILDTQTPFVVDNRLVSVPLHLIVLLANNFTANITVLQTVFGLAYAAIPFAALAASWWIVGERQRHLFVWAAFGIGLATLPGQFNFVAEAYIALQLAWPIVLAVLLCMPGRAVPLVLLLSVMVLFSHPHASVLFAVATLLAVLVARQSAPERRKLLVWAAVFGAFAGLSALRVLLLRSDYESGQMSPAILAWNFDVAVMGLPLLAVVCTLAAAISTALAPRIARRGLRSVVYNIGWAGLLLSGVALLLWARDPAQWMWANKFTIWALFPSLVCMGLAAAEVLWPRSLTPRALAASWRQRVRLIQVIGAIFALVLVVQSTVWLGETSRLRALIDASPWPCISMAPVKWLERSPLGEWGTPAYALLIQGRSPEKLVLNGDRCNASDFGQGLSLDGSTLRSWDRGWFNLLPLGQRLIGEQLTPEGCSFALSSGWHRSETDGPYWWRWSDGQDAQLRVLAERELTATLSGEIESIEAPNSITVLVNGTQHTTVELAESGLQPLRLTDLPLRSGSNTIQLVSRNAPLFTSGRSLGISVANLTMTSGDPTLACRFRP